MNTAEIIGKNEEEATHYLKENHIKYRIVSKNGEHYFLTMDIQPKRWNLTIHDNVIKKVTLG